MTKEQIEKKAREMANKYPEVGYNSRYHREIYAAAMEMAEWLLGEISERATSLLKEVGEKK